MSQAHLVTLYPRPGISYCFWEEVPLGGQWYSETKLQALGVLTAAESALLGVFPPVLPLILPRSSLASLGWCPNFFKHFPHIFLVADTIAPMSSGARMGCSLSFCSAPHAPSRAR